MNGQGRQGDIPTSVFLNDRHADCGQDSVNLFASHFASVYCKDNLPAYNPPFHTDLRLTGLSLELFDINKCLSNLDTRSSPGPDGLHPLFLKSCCTLLAEPLLLIFNASLSQGFFPPLWKESFSTPLFKSGDRRDVKNYRPISKLNVIAKMFDLGGRS